MLNEFFEILSICVKMNLALNNLQRLAWHKTQKQTNQLKFTKSCLNNWNPMKVLKLVLEIPTRAGYSSEVTSSPIQGDARGVMVIVAGYGHGDTSSIPEPDWLHFT